MQVCSDQATPPLHLVFVGSENVEEYGTEVDDTSESKSGSLHLRLPKSSPKDAKQLRLEVISSCHGDLFEEIVASESCEESGEGSDYDEGGLAFHKDGGHRRHRHHDRDDCERSQFVDVYELSDVYDSIEVQDLMPGPAKIIVTILGRSGVLEEGVTIVDIVPGEITPALVELYKVGRGGVAIDIIEAGEGEDSGDGSDEPEERRVPREPRQELTWEKLAVKKHDSVKSSCKGDSFVAFNKAYGLWVAAVTCDENRYKLLLGKTKDGTFYEIADNGGHGQDHCELVNPSFEIPDDDDITSGCADCAIGEMHDPIGTPAFVRGYVGEDFAFTSKTVDWGDLSSDWLECGIPIK